MDKMMDNKIQNQVDNFIKYIQNGWETELAFDCCYDMIYDLIGAEDFLNMCQEAINNHKLTVTVSM